jgi:dihydropteroate synthase
MHERSFRFWLAEPVRPTLVMGVLNCTPDSFSDGGDFWDVDRAVARGLAMVDEGASIIDVGGESTRPGADPVESAEQIRRVIPVIEALAGRDPELNAVLSIDTTRADVAEAALDAGASLVNDVSAGRDDMRMFGLVAKREVPIVLMHRPKASRTDAEPPEYEDVVGEVMSFLLDRAEAAERAGIRRTNILLDIGIGFGKSIEHNLELLRAYRSFSVLGYPTVLGLSRKRMIGILTHRDEPGDRMLGSVAGACWGVAHGASIVRVHDVAETVEALGVITALTGTRLKIAH